jgi:ribose-phosphate pyrophosphokinase
MIKLYDYEIPRKKFADNSANIKIPNILIGRIKRISTEITYGQTETILEWYYECDEELVHLIYITRYLQDKGIHNIKLFMPYIPNARMDRIEEFTDVFTLKYFAEIINSLHFAKIVVCDPHSNVALALIHNLEFVPVNDFIRRTISTIRIKEIPDNEKLILFYPDANAASRYIRMFQEEYTVGILKQNFLTGVTDSLGVADESVVRGNNILMIDDICPRGALLYNYAKKLKELGALKIYLYATHCENSILNSELLKSHSCVEEIFTTTSIFTKYIEDETGKIKIYEYGSI